MKMTVAEFADTVVRDSFINDAKSRLNDPMFLGMFHDEYHRRGYSYENMVQYHKLCELMGIVLRPRVILASSYAACREICRENNWHFPGKPSINYPNNPHELYGFRGVPIMLATGWNMMRQSGEYYFQVQAMDGFLINSSGDHITVQGHVIK